MHCFLDYAPQHRLREDENPPIGLILCSEKNEALAYNAISGLPNYEIAAEYRLTLPNEKILTIEHDRTRQAMETRCKTSADDEQEYDP